jgi:hypothetical protein
MQQKYCDHGRSTAVSKMTRPMCRARSSCGSGGKARNASILPAMYKSFGFSLGLPIQCRSFLGSRPTSAAIDKRAQLGPGKVGVDPAAEAAIRAGNDVLAADDPGVA